MLLLLFTGVYEVAQLGVADIGLKALLLLMFRAGKGEEVLEGSLFSNDELLLLM